MNRDRGLAAVISACSVALLLPLAWPLFTGKVFVYNDLTWFHLPMRYLYQQALASGDSVLWTPSILAGLYLHGEGQLGMFHPLHQLLYRVFPLQAAFDLELIASYPAAFAGTFWFLRRLQFGRAAALFGAMLFAFSGFNLLHHHHVNMVAVVAHLPWLLAAADVLFVDDRPRARAAAFAGVALILGSEFLIGFPQAVWWNAMTLAAFVAYRCAETGRWRRIAACAAAIAVGVMLGAIQILPSADAAAHSVRLTLSRDFALTYSLHPFNLFQLWSPYFFERGGYGRLDYPWFHELGIYSGAILQVALIYVWIRRRALPGRRLLIASATAFAATTLVLALGRYGGLAVLLTYLPVLESLRAPVRYIVLTQFSLAILAAIAMEDLIAIADGRVEAPRGWLPAIWIPAAMSVATLILLNAHVLSFGRQTFSTVAAAAPGVAFVVGVTLLVVMAARRVPWAIVALVVVTAADLAFWGLRFIYHERPRRITALIQSAEPPPPGAAVSYAAPPGDGPLRSDMLVMRGYRLTSGYLALYPATRHPLDSAAWRRLSGTEWLILRNGARIPAPPAEPRARIVDEAGRRTTGAARMAVDRPGYLVVNVDTSGAARLALTERFDEGWSATISGQPVQPIAIEDDFLGCRVPAGSHRVVLRFMPRSFVRGAIGSAIGVALLVAGVLVMLAIAPKGRA
jgi:Bacterial membrane protein YfhO